MSDIASVPASPGSTTAAPAGEPQRFEFTGSGSEYFKIWIVNVLLTIVTLGIYYLTPWLRWDRGPYAPDQAVLIENPIQQAVQDGGVVGEFLVGVADPRVQIVSMHLDDQTGAVDQRRHAGLGRRLGRRQQQESVDRRIVGDQARYRHAGL